MDRKLKLQYAKLKKSLSRLPKTRILAKDMIYEKMIVYNTKAREILAFLIENYKKSDKAQFEKLKQLYIQMRQCDEIVIDCAHKLAPYQSPKLESVEVRSKVEHRYVMQVPQPMKSAADWMKMTGAEALKESDTVKVVAVKKTVPSIHDFVDEDEQYLDEADTFNKTIN
jgi:ribosomal 50S subunit-recycling heat shock protein